MALTVGNIKRVGGSLALDFANSVDWRLSEAPHDWLSTYDDLIAWARASGGLTAAQKTALGKLARKEPKKAAKVFSQAIELREAIDRLARTIARNAKPGKGDLAILNKALAKCPARNKVDYGRGSYGWSLPETDLSTPLWHLAWSAADLFAGQDRERVKVCAGEDCGWLFVDRSRNIARRWCSMSDCGNRDKARRFYARHKND